MPKLSENTNLEIPANFLLGSEMILAMQTFTEPVRRMNEAVESWVRPIRQMQEAMESAILPIRIMQESLNISLAPMIKAMNAYAEIAEAHRKMFERVSLLGFNNNAARSVGLGIFPKGLRFEQVIDGEITEEERPPQTQLMQQVMAVPQSQALVSVAPSFPGYQTKSVLGLKEISGRSFQFKRKTLKKLSYRNSEGRFLSLLLGSQDLFISDNDIRDKLHIPDVRSFSWVLRNLKRKFRANGLSVTIERRWSPDGYILIDISYLQ